jgi:hypothetical protein
MSDWKDMVKGKIKKDALIEKYAMKNGNLNFESELVQEALLEWLAIKRKPVKTKEFKEKLVALRPPLPNMMTLRN